MNRIAVFAKREWSFLNLEPALKGLDYTRVTSIENHKEYDLVITCEPHMQEWRDTYTNIKGKVPVLGLQQGLFYSTKKSEHASYPCDKYMVWGEQMRDSCRRNGLPDEKIIVTGCPKHDKMFTASTKDDGFVLLLEGGEIDEVIPSWDTNRKTIRVEHPNRTGYKLTTDTYELMRCAHSVVVHSTGCGIWSLILKKPTVILGNNERFLNWQEDWFVEWAVTDQHSADRVRKVIYASVS